SADPSLDAIKRALLARDWRAASRELQQHVIARSPRFVIHPNDRTALSARILRDFPTAAADAAARADRIASGRYDLLGYRDLSFDDWHSDPVNQRRAPVRFWTTVPYLDPSCGDHKVIWELNRHQHWLALGRAYWLTGNPRYRDRFL